MKALLMITGLMPEFDSQMRGELTRARKSGLTSQQVLPRNTFRLEVDQSAICLSCWQWHREILIEGIGGSRRPELVEAPGRVFDILLFM
jgi:hypothetical protein